MPRRAFCTGDHTWEHVTVRGSDRWDCANCPARFPCADICAHLDCEEFRGKPPLCPTCEKPAAWGDSIMVSRGDRGIRIHNQCLKGVQPDDEEAAAPAA
jgi:hypothetical protein